MHTLEPGVVTLTTLALDASALAVAVLEDDMDEVRFRTHRLASKADALGLSAVSTAAAFLGTELGPSGTTPALGYGAGLMRLADMLCSIAVPS